MSSQPTVDRITEKEAAARFHYASHALASAVVSHAQGMVSGSMPAAQWFESSRQRFSLLLQRLMTNSSSLLQVLKIFDAAQRILLEGSDVPEPPESLIRRFGSLSLKQKQTASSDVLKASLSGTSIGLKESVQEDFTSKLLRGFVALLPPNLLPVSESEKRGEAFIEAVDKVARCSDSLQERKILFCSSFTNVGCGPDCPEYHDGDGVCLVCGQGWYTHHGVDGHTCRQGPFGSRGSWLTSSQEVSSLLEVGTIITFNITHSSASTPKVILGLSRYPRPLTRSGGAPHVDLGLDLGKLDIIGGDATHPVDIGMLRKALSFSRSAVIK
jgi:hypothetical protein